MPRQEQPDFSRKAIEETIRRQHAEVQRLNDKVASDWAKVQQPQRPAGK